MSDYGDLVHPQRIPFSCVTCGGRKKFRAVGGDTEDGLVYYECPSCEDQRVTVDLCP